MESFTLSPRLQAFLKRWPSRVTADVPQIQDFTDNDFPTPRGHTANKSTSIYFSKSDGSLFQAYAADSGFNTVEQVSQY